MTIYRLCSACGGKYPMAGRSTGKCPDCLRIYQRERGRQRRATSHAVRARDSRLWQHVRAAARARDKGCVLAHRGGCQGVLQVHHIVPIERGGSEFDLANLRTLCRAHHEQAERDRFFLGADSHPLVARRETHTRNQVRTSETSAPPVSKAGGMTKTAERRHVGARPGAGRPRVKLAQLVDERRFDWQNPRHRRALRDDYLSHRVRGTLAGRAGWNVWQVDQLVQAYGMSESVGARGPASWLAQQFGLLVTSDGGEG